MRLLTALLLVWAWSVNAATYYVNSSTGNDANVGSIGSPWRTLHISIPKLVAGDTLNCTGMFDEPNGGVSWQYSVAGTFGNPIIIQGFGAGATIVMEASSSVWFGIHRFTGQYIQLQNLGITSAGNSNGGVVNGGVAVSFEGANCSILNCEVSNVTAQVVSSGDTCEVFGDYTDHTTYSNLFIHGTKDSDLWRMFGSYNLITHCVISNCNNANYSAGGNHADLIQNWARSLTDSALSNVFECNLYISNGIPGTGVGPTLGISGGIYQCFLSGNQFSQQSPNMHDWIFRNNVFDVANQELEVETPGMHFYNNVFYNWHGGLGCMYLYSQQVASGAHFYNNVFINSPISDLNGGSSKTMDYNAIDSISSSQSQNLTVGTYGPNNFAVTTGSAGFVNPGAGDFHLTSGSALIGKGINLYNDPAMSRTDKDGVARPSVGAWDIGPYQFVAGGATYYVATNGSSSNSGLSSGSPWPLDYSGLHTPSGSTVMVAPGFYAGVQLDVETNGVTWIVQPKWSAILSNINPSCIVIGFSNPNSSTNNVIDGFLVTNSWKAGIDMYSGTNTIRNCWIRGSGFGQVSQNASGIFCENNGKVNHCLFERNLLEFNNIANDGAHDWGIYLNGTDHLVRYNVSRHNAGGFTPPPSGTVLFENNITYENTFYGIAGAMSGGVETMIGNTIIETNFAFFASGSGSFLLTNNIVICGSSIISGANILSGDYNLLSSAAFTQAHGVINSSPGCVNTNNGLYWLVSGSAARGIALSVHDTNDFFGNPISFVSDDGAVQYALAYANDTRTLEPSPVGGADYWGGVGPSIVTQPQPQNLQVSQTINLNVSAIGTTPLYYFWRFGGTFIAGATQSSYTKGNAQLSDSGNYSVIVSNIIGTVTSSTVAVSVTNPAVAGIGISQQRLDFGFTPTNVPVQLAFSVQNTGSGTLNGTASANAPFSILSGGTYALPAGASQTVTVQFTPTSVATNSDVVTLTGGGGTNVTVGGLGYAICPTNAISMNAAVIQSPFVLSSGTIYQTIDTPVISVNPGFAVVGFTLPIGVTNLALGAMVEATNTSNNSVWVAVDAFPTDPANIWDETNIIASPGLAFQTVTWRGTGTSISPTISPLVVSLGAGPHYIIIMGRESNNRIGTFSVAPFQGYPNPPLITTQPQSQTVVAGSPVQFTVVATGTVPLSYQWNFNGVSIPGANQTAYSIASTLPLNSGLYFCTVTNVAGSANSIAASLIVTNSTPINVRVHFHGKH